MSGAQLRVWPAISRATIAPELYAHQIDMVGEGVYEGIWTGRAARLPNEEGIRMDVLALLKHLRVPLLKWPGDAFARHYHWKDGIGTGKAREQRVNIPGQAIEPNTFGTHEFLLLCEKLGCKPWITCNGATGGLREAMEWLEYCTFGGDTTLTALRSHNGQPDPFEAPYWSYDGPEGSAVLRTLNSDIIDIGDAITDTKQHKKRPKLHQFAVAMPTSGGRDFGERAYRASFVGLRLFEAEIERNLALLDAAFPGKRVKAAINQWGVCHPEANPEAGMEQPSTLRDALLAASALNLLNEHAGRIAIACMADAINSNHCLVKTQGRDMYLTPTYHVFDLMAPHKGARLLYRELECPKMPLPRDRNADVSSIPALNASASRARKRLCITVTNQSYSDTVPLSVEIREAEIATLGGRVLTAPSATAENTFENPKAVAPSRLDLTPDGNTFHYAMPPHSLAAFTVGLR